MSFDYFSQRRMQYILEKLKDIFDTKADTSSIPTKTSDLQNDSDFVADASYVHTDNNFTDSLKSKVDNLGTAATKDVATSGNASSSQVVMGNDTRLTDSRPASDVYDWAKASTKPTYTASEVGLGNVGNYKAVSTVANQGLTDTEKANSRANIGAGTSNFSGAYDDLSGKPTLGTASAKDVPTSGNASTTQVVMGNDTRLTDARNAADVYSWAKASTKPSYTASEVGAIATTAKGTANGVAELDSTGKVPSAQLPSYVDDVIEGYYYNGKFYKESTHETEISGESGKIYVDLATDKTYRWSGTAFTQIKGDLALGETSSTAYRGDRGKTAYDHATDSNRLTTATDSGLYKVAATAEGHVKSLTAVEKADITALGIPGSDTNDAVTQTATTTNSDYEVLFSNSANNTTETAGARKNNNLLFNPSTGNLKATKLNGSTIGNSPKFTDENVKQELLLLDHDMDLTPKRLLLGDLTGTETKTAYKTSTATYHLDPDYLDTNLQLEDEIFIYQNGRPLSDFEDSMTRYMLMSKYKPITTSLQYEEGGGLWLQHSLTTNGTGNMGIDNTGRLYLGSGSSDLELYYSHKEGSFGRDGKQMFLSSYNDIYLNSGVTPNSSTRKGLLLNSSGELIPTQVDSPTNNIMKIGTSSYKFAEGNFTKINGQTVGDSPKFTDTTYESKSASSGGTDVSLVTTGEKYTWNSKVSENPTFTEASSRANIASGESFATILGKIKKFFSDLKTVAFTGAYSDLTGTPTIPTVNNGTLTIQKNGTDVATFSANQSSNATANIQVVEPDSTIKTNTTGQFNTTTGGILDSCDVKLEPIQDLHGYTKPWVGGSGKNLIPMTVDAVKSTNTAGTWSGNTYSLRGCEVTINTDDDGNIVSYTVNRVSTSTSNLVFYLVRDLVIAQESILNGCPSGGSDSTYRIRTSDSDYDYGSGVTIQPKTTGIYIRVEASYNIQNVTFYPMLRKATVTDATFEPYTNICGITGHSSVEVDISDSTDYTTALSATVYGGNIDVVSGSGKSKYIDIDLSAQTWNYNSASDRKWFTCTVSDVKATPNYQIADMYCECYELSTRNDIIANPSADSLIAINTAKNIIIRDLRFTDPTDLVNALSGMHLIAERDTYADITCTPTQIETLIGQNNISVPLEGQSLDSLSYREMMAWDDVNDNFKVHINNVGDNSFTFSQGNDTTSVTIVDRSRAKAECLAYINAQEGMVVPDMAYEDYAVGEHFMHKGKFCTAITPITQGNMLILNTNYVEGTIADELETIDHRSNNFYGTCATAADTAAKTVVLSDARGFQLKAGTIVGIKFSYTNTASNVTLNINNTGDKSIYYSDAVYTGNSSNVVGAANRVFYYMYDGTYWVFLNQTNNGTNTTYSAMSVAEMNAATATTSRVIRADRLRPTVEDWIDAKIPGAVSKTANGLCPQLPNETSTSKFLRQDGTWAEPSGGSGSNNYSTTKTAVGTWIDGRTIYKQTFEETISASGTKSITIGSNIDFLIEGSAIYVQDYDFGTFHTHDTKNCDLTYLPTSSSNQLYCQAITTSSVGTKDCSVSFYIPTYPTGSSVSNISAKLYVTVTFVEYAS